MFYKNSIFNFNFYIELTRKKLDEYFVVLNYHQVGNDYNSKYNNLGNFTEINFFEDQMIWLKSNYKVIPLYEAIQMANNNKLDDKYACITFDDGDKSILAAMQILKKYNLPATFFINSRYLDNQNACWFHTYQYIKNSLKFYHLLTEDIQRDIKYLRNTNNNILYRKRIKDIEKLFIEIKDDFDMFVSYKDLQSIDNPLFNIGLHGAEHQRFSMMDKKWQRNNITEDIKKLSILKSYKPIFAIPFGKPHDWNKSTIRICIELGLEIVFANDGINYHNNIGYSRIPADGRKLKKIL